MHDHVESHGSGSGLGERKTKNGRLATFTGGLILLIPSGLGLLLSRVPTIFCPFPALTVLPAFGLSSLDLWPVAVIVPTLLFFAWNTGLFRGEAKIPKRSLWLLVVAILLSVIWFGVGWKDGLQYQGTRYVYGVAFVNVAWVTLLSVTFARHAKYEFPFRANLVLHLVLFAWLAWYA